MTQVTFDKLATDPETHEQIVWLRSLEDGNQMYSLSIGGAEALSIYISLTGKRAPLPLENDLTETILDRLKAQVNQVNLVEMQDGTVYAELVLAFQEGQMNVEVCPGDSIALALKYRAPIFLSEYVLERGASGASGPAELAGEGSGEPLDELPEFILSEEEIAAMDPNWNDDIVPLDDEPGFIWTGDEVLAAIEDLLGEAQSGGRQAVYDPKENLKALRAQMAEAVKQERYEEAGQLRAEIARVEGEMDR